MGHYGRPGPKGEQRIPGPRGNCGSKGQKGERGSPGEGCSTSKEQRTDSTPTSSSEQCGGPGWRRVAFINMSDPNQECPQGLRLTPYTKRSCHREDRSTYAACSSVQFPVGCEYSQVCGRAAAYRWGRNFAFYDYHNDNVNLSTHYVDGISLTHGPEKTHIWTFASGLFNWSDWTNHPIYRCPCDPGNPYHSPPFVGNDYFCESIDTSSGWREPLLFYPDNKLWDGEDCEASNTCCAFNSPPWFYKQLNSTISDDIELRLCLRGHWTYTDIALEELELYVS